MTKARDLANIISGGFTEADIPNLSASKITSGTFADARIASSNVSQHATSFDDNKIVNDISTLALRQASDGNRSSYNTNSQFVDVFQDATGIDTTSNAVRNDNEYVSAAAAATITTAITLDSSNYTDYIDVTKLSNRKQTTGNTDDARFNPELASNVNLASPSDFIPNTVPNASQEETVLGYKFGNSTNTTQYLWQNTDTSQNYRIIMHNMRFKENMTFKPTNGGNFSITWRNGSGSLNTTQGVQSYGLTEDGTGDTAYSPTNLSTNSGSLSNNTTYNQSISNSSNTFFDGLSVRVFHTSNNEYMFNNISWEGTIAQPGFTVNATGNFTGTTITAPSSVSSMGAIITYQDNVGQNALNTDIVLQLSADGGSNYSTATLTALPDFSTGIKMAKVNDLSVTAGTSLKYKISFANQASGSKEARIRGVSLQY